jgi:hypothetical protein
MVLQAALVGVLAFLAGFAYWANDFSHGMVRDQLSEQKIFFPPAGSEALNEEEYPNLQKYGGEQVLDGEQAKAYADDFIGHHLEGVAGGMTYSEASTASREDPDNAELAGQVQTLFRGETLRGLLLNAYGWWTLGQYALYAGIGLTVATVIVLASLVFEAARWMADAWDEKQSSRAMARAA